MSTACQRFQHTEYFLNLTRRTFIINIHHTGMISNLPQTPYCLKSVKRPVIACLFQSLFQDLIPGFGKLLLINFLLLGRQFTKNKFIRTFR